MNELLKSDVFEDRQLGAHIFIQEEQWKLLDIIVWTEHNQGTHLYCNLTPGDPRDAIRSFYFSKNAFNQQEYTICIAINPHDKNVILYKIYIENINKFISYWNIKPIFI